MNGRKFGRLTVLQLLPARKKKSYVYCRCDCGVEKEFRLANIKNGNTQSCGCLRKERTKETHTTHGKTGSIEYQSWQDMLKRCNNTNNDRYDDYGGRGIKVCDRWLKFEKFLEDMGMKPSKYHSIERVDNEGDY